MRIYNLNRRTHPTFSDGTPFVGPLLSLTRSNSIIKFGKLVLTQCGMNEMAAIQARIILPGFQAKLGLFKMGTQLLYFSNLLESEKDGNIVDSDLEIYVKHLKNLSEDFEVLFKDLQWMRVPDWIVTLFDFNVQNADINSQLQDELTDMRVDLKAQSLFKRKNLRDSAI